MSKLLNHYYCPCCGYRTLDIEPPGKDIICPICFWEDNGEIIDSDGYIWLGSNKVSLHQGQRNFINFGACEQEWLNYVRLPTANDNRDPNWQPIDSLAETIRLDLIEKIAIAFKDVTLEDGVSLHEARALDDYEDGKKARLIDWKIQWQEIPANWIEKFYDVFVFMDAKGLQHAIPAYMTWCLKHNKTDANSFDSIYSYLRDKFYSNDIKCKEQFNLLNEPQRQVILEFIRFLDTFAYSV